MTFKRLEYKDHLHCNTLSHYKCLLVISKRPLFIIHKRHTHKQHCIIINLIYNLEKALINFETGRKQTNRWRMWYTHWR